MTLKKLQAKKIEYLQASDSNAKSYEKAGRGHGDTKSRLAFVHKVRLTDGEKTRNVLPPNKLFHGVVAEERARRAASASPTSPRALSPCPLWHKLLRERQKLRERTRRWASEKSRNHREEVCHTKCSQKNDEEPKNRVIFKSRVLRGRDLRLFFASAYSRSEK